MNQHNNQIIYRIKVPDDYDENKDLKENVLTLEFNKKNDLISNILALY